MFKILIIILSTLILSFIYSPAAYSAEDSYLILAWDHDSHSRTRVSTGTIMNMYNACAALKYYPGVHLTVNPCMKLLEEYEAFATVTDTTTVPVERIAMLKELISIYRAYQESGRIEVSVEPLAEAVLPLLYDTRTAKKVSPGISLPEVNFSYPHDTRALVFRTIKFYKKYFNVLPAGLYPLDGALSNEIAGILSGAGFKWTLGGQYLSRSIDTGPPSGNPMDIINRSMEGSVLYRPYFITERDLALFIPDEELSLELANPFMRAEKRVDRLVKKINRIMKKWEGEVPPVVTVTIDSQKAWNSEDAGEFLASLYNRLESERHIKAVTPLEYLDIYMAGMDVAPAQSRLKDIFPGTWKKNGFEAWIGEEEENKAWEYLARTRQVLEEYKNSGKAETEKLDRAFRNIYSAESGTWFWWYGNDYDSGMDRDYDQKFRFLLIDTYKYIGGEPPAEFFNPIVKPDVLLGRPITGKVTPSIDGIVAEGEWDSAGSYINPPGGRIFDKVYYGYDANSLYLRLDTGAEFETGRAGSMLAFYIGAPGSDVNNVYTRFGERNFEYSLKYGLSFEVAVWLDNPEKAVLSLASGDDEWSPVTGLYNMKLKENILELAIPLKYLDVSPGDAIKLTAIAVQDEIEYDMIPSSVTMTVPAVEAMLEGIAAEAEIIRVNDPRGDSFGPGWFTYAEESIFNRKSFDFLSFIVKEDQENVTIELRLAALENTIQTPLGIGPQLIDIYIDLNNNLGAGNTGLLDERNVYTIADDAWEWVITINGWKQELYKMGAGAPVKVSDVKTEVIGNTIRISIPKTLIPGDAGNRGYIPVISAQDCSNFNEGTIPAEDAGKVSKIMPLAGEYNIGGALEGLLNPNILDVVLPPGKCQTCILEVYKKGNAVQLPAIRK